MKMENNPNSTIVLGGDFNMPDIDWDSNTVKQQSTRKTLHTKLLDTVSDHTLYQLQTTPTRGENLLDLYITNKPRLTRSTCVIPGISVHYIVVADSDIQPLHSKKTTKNYPPISQSEVGRNEKRRQQTLALSSWTSTTPETFIRNGVVLNTT